MDGQRMEVHFTPDVAAKLSALATETGRPPEDLVQDAVASYIDDLAEVRTMLDNRYDNYKSGKVKPVDGKAYFERLRRRV